MVRTEGLLDGLRKVSPKGLLYSCAGPETGVSFLIPSCVKHNFHSENEKAALCLEEEMVKCTESLMFNISTNTTREQTCICREKHFWAAKQKIFTATPLLHLIYPNIVSV